MAKLLDCVPVVSMELIDPTLLVTVTLAPKTETANGATFPALSATWTTGAVDNPYLTGIQFEYGRSDGLGGTTRTAAQGKEMLSWLATQNVMPGINYAVRYRAVGENAFGPWSAPQTIMTSGSLISTGIDGQGPGATAPGGSVLNQYVPLGNNRVVNSELLQPAGSVADAMPSGWASGWNGTATTALARQIVGTDRKAFKVYTSPSGAVSPAGTLFDVAANYIYPPTSGGIRRFAAPCKPGDRIAFSARISTRKGRGFAFVSFFDAAFNQLSATEGTSVTNGGTWGDDANPAGMILSSGIATAPANTAYVAINGRLVVDGTGQSIIWMMEPMLAQIADGQTAIPAYTPGIADRGADPTGENTAAAIQGQGALATLNAVDRAKITGVDFINLVDGTPTTDASWRTGYESQWTFGVTPNASLDEGQPIVSFTRSETGLTSSQFLGAIWHDFIATVGITYLVSIKVRGTADAKGLARLELYFYDKDGGAIGSATNVGQKLLTGSGDTSTYIFSGVFKAPAGAVRGAIRLRMAADSAGVSAGQFRWRQPIVVKAARLGEGLVREDGTTVLTDGTVITLLGTANSIVGQGAYATTALSLGRISRLKDNGRSLNAYQSSNPLLTGVTMYRNPVYVLGTSVNGSSARISVSAFTLNLSGASLISFSAGTINGAAFNTKYSVWAYDPDLAGGAVTYVATTDPNAYIGNPDYLYLDTVTTVTSGGGSGTPPPIPVPPGGDPLDPSCVCVDSWMPGDVQAQDIVADSPLAMLLDDGSGVYTGPCQGVRRALAYCVRLTTVSGVELDCSTSTPIPHRTADGVGYKQAWELDGTETLAVVDQHGFRWERLAKVPAHIGRKRVVMISANNGVYAAGRDRTRFIFTHNIRWKG